MAHKKRADVAERAFSLGVGKRGLFTVLTPTGDCSGEGVELVARDFLHKPAFLAIDLSHLNEVNLPLVQALHAYAARLDPAQGRLVFLRPPDNLRSLFRAVAEDYMPVVLAEGDLEGELPQVEDRMRVSLQRLFHVRAQLKSNTLWRLAGAQSHWFCPFCATPRPDIKFSTRGEPSEAVVERVCRHLAEECAKYTAGASPEFLLAAGDSKAQESRVNERLRKADLMQEDLELARERHRRMLPQAAPAVPHCEIAIWYRPAGIVGGDFYDFIPLPGRRVGIVAGDVSGHGIEAAVLMGMAKKVINMRLRDLGDALQALLRANEDLHGELDRQSFVTAVVGILDGERREIWIARAGHVPPFLVRPGSPPTVQRLETPGPALGLVMAGAFERGIQRKRVALQPGDVLLFHTDGLEDVKNTAGEDFSAERVEEVLTANVGLGATGVLEALSKGVDGFRRTAEQEDDITAVCVKIL